MTITGRNVRRYLYNSFKRGTGKFNILSLALKTTKWIHLLFSFCANNVSPYKVSFNLIFVVWREACVYMCDFSLKILWNTYFYKLIEYSLTNLYFKRYSKLVIVMGFFTSFFTCEGVISAFLLINVYIRWALSCTHIQSQNFTLSLHIDY